jgi:hypothetical protein
MSTLLEKARPELLLAIEKYKAKFPIISEGVEKELSKIEHVVDLRYGTWSDLKNMYVGLYNIEPTTPFLLFL